MIELTIMLSIGLFTLYLIITPVVLCLFDFIFKTHFSCIRWGWHNGDGGDKSYDGCSLQSKCSKCGKDVLEDSQGNWF